MSIAVELAALDLPDETPVQVIRRRMQRRVCVACAAPVRGRRVVCVACAATVGYCPTCEQVLPVAAMESATAARRRAGALHNGRCKACKNAERPPRPSTVCRRCRGACGAGRRVCVACAAEWAYCPACWRVKRRTSFSGGGGGKARATYCRRCSAAQTAARTARKVAADAIANAERNVAIVAAYVANVETLRAIGAPHGLSGKAVLQIARRAGVPQRPRNGRAAAAAAASRALDAACVAAYLARHESGETLRAIGARLGRSPSSVARAVRRAGVRPAGREAGAG